MDIDLRPKELAKAAGISPSHASNILSGTRKASDDIALAAFRAFGVRLGLLAEMTDADIAKLASQPVAECHGFLRQAQDQSEYCEGESESVHGATDNAGDASLSTGQFDQLSRESNDLGGGQSEQMPNPSTGSARTGMVDLTPVFQMIKCPYHL